MKFDMELVLAVKIWLKRAGRDALNNLGSEPKVKTSGPSQPPEKRGSLPV